MPIASAQWFAIVYSKDKGATVRNLIIGFAIAFTMTSLFTTNLGAQHWCRPSCLIRTAPGFMINGPGPRIGPSVREENNAHCDTALAYGGWSRSDIGDNDSYPVFRSG
jgi:hypothetical protein